jgi:hypothetical protein
MPKRAVVFLDCYSCPLNTARQKTALCNYMILSRHDSVITFYSTLYVRNTHSPFDEKWSSLSLKRILNVVNDP